MKIERCCFKKHIAIIIVLCFLGPIAYGKAETEEKMGIKTIKFSNIVDLSHLITPEIPLWPGDPRVEFKTVARLEKDGYYLRRFSIGEHSATHMNAPNSFHHQGAGIDAYAPQSLVQPAVVIDVSHNPQGVATTLAFIRRFYPPEHIHVLTFLQNDKELCL